MRYELCYINHKACLVIVGVLADGRQGVVALEDGYRESTESWASVLSGCGWSHHSGVAALSTLVVAGQETSHIPPSILPTGPHAT